MGEFSRKGKPKIKTKERKLMLASLTGATSGPQCVVTTCYAGDSSNQLTATTGVSIKLTVDDDDKVQSGAEQPAPIANDKFSAHEKSSDLLKNPQGVYEVRLAFIELARFKRMQYFYLAALIYSVISTMLILSFWPLILQSSTCQLVPADDDTLSGDIHLNSLKLSPSSLVIFLGLSIILSLVLAVLLFWSTLASSKWAVGTAARSVGLFCVLGLLEMPTLLLFSSNSSFHLGSGCMDKQVVKVEPLSYRLLAPTSLVILYLAPLLFESSEVGVVTRLACAALAGLLPALGLTYSLGSEGLIEEDFNRELTPQTFASWIVICLLAGLLRRLRFTHLIGRSAFTRADQLIEAKVGLEHQRQQQETLLLSVLPAYVAEQVKRNMVKKITSSFFQGTSSTGSPCSSLAQPQQPQVIATSAIGNSASTSYAFQQQVSYPSETHSSAKEGGCSHSITLAPTSGSFSNSIGGGYGQQAGAVTSNLPNLPQDPNPQATQNTLNSFLAMPFINNKRESQGASQVVKTACQTVHSHPSMINSGSLGAQQGMGHARRGFNELYIRTYNNVSLLYGDIVGFTKLCTQLSSSQLVRVLNNLFSHFDHLAERHRIMRIKILGDCYYGVAGIPEFAVTGSKSHKLSRLSHSDNHAINCVNMGLDMINYIRRLNVERAADQQVSPHDTSQPQLIVTDEVASSQQAGLSWPAFELNMRIGIHTGHIHSGVIGLKKWQFDVWSNDVSIAMHCESSGVAGRIHVTEATIQQLEGAFTYELAQGAQKDSFLTAKDIRTYLIRDRSQKHHVNSIKSKSPAIPKQALAISEPQLLDYTKQSDKLQITSSHQVAVSIKPTDEENIRAATIGTIRQTLLSGDDQVTQQQHLSDLSFSQGRAGLFFNWHDLQPWTLKFRDKSMARLYKNRQTINLPYELLTLASLFLLLFMRSIIWSTSHQPTSGDNLPSCFLKFTQIFTALIFAFLLLSSIEFQEQQNLSHIDKDTKVKRRSFIWRLKTLRGKFRRILELKNEITSRARNCSSILIVIVVVTVESYTVNQHFCSILKQSGSEILPERYQLTVILLLICLDFSVNLLGYWTKLFLISSVLFVHMLPILPINTSQHLSDHLFLSRCATLKSEVPPPGNASNQQPLIQWFIWSLIFVMILWSFVLAEQLEYAARTSFLWRSKLSVDHEELEYISGINKLLLENILPSHVVQHYLTHSPPDTAAPNTAGEANQQVFAANTSAQNSSCSQLTASFANLQSYMRMSFSSMRNTSGNHELYHEQHESVAVMFASIPHFYEFYDESDINKQGLGCIALLNEIICDFDKLLLKNKFSRIEKIKTIGSTYMAAAGLRPNSMTGGRNSTVSEMSFNSAIASGSQSGGFSTPMKQSQAQKCIRLLDTPAGAGGDGLLGDEEQRKQVLSQQKLNLICMIQFASSLMSALNGINKQSFQVFKLRIGVNAGSVIAGVIGAQRPFYDIWGDCVNIASRMESLGEIGRIQVEEKTAQLLIESLCIENYSIVKRGPIDVKGKGGMVTYFVDKKENNSSNTYVTEQPVDANCTGKAGFINSAASHHQNHPSQCDLSSSSHNNNLLPVSLSMTTTS